MNAVEITHDNFHQEVMESQQPVLLDFYADWCGPCRSQWKILEELSQQDWNQWKVCKVNIDENLPLTDRFGVYSVPTLMVVKDGNVVTSKTGLRDKQEVLEMLKS